MTIKAKVCDRFALWFISWFGPLLILLLGATWRIRWKDQENLVQAQSHGRRVIYAFWHGRMLVLSYSHRCHKIHILVSRHRDGEYIARTVRRLGIVPVRGSTTRDGLRAFFRMADRALAGYDLAITPDGPRGPRHKAQLGVIYIAQRTGAPIVPLTNSAEKRWLLSSWDRFLIPKPFSRVLIVYGKPMYIDEKLNSEGLEKQRVRLEEELIRVTEEADRFFI